MLDHAKNRGERKPYLRNLNVRWFEFDLSDVAEMRFETGEVERYSVKRGDLVICEGGYPGRAAIWNRDEPVFFQKALHRVRFHEKAFAKWCLYYLAFQDATGELRSQFTGTGIQHFTRETLAKFLLPTPPIHQVRRIVAILDEAFEGIATAKTNIQESLQNARELFSSRVDTLFRQSAGWEQAPLESFTATISTGPFGSLLHKSDYVTAGVPLVNPINIVDRSIVPDPNKLIDDTTKQRLANYVLQNGDVVVARRGEIGRCAVVGPTEAGWLCGTGCFFIRLKPTVRPAFIVHMIRSRGYRAQLERLSTGTTMNNISNSALGALTVAVPSLSVQDETLELIERLSDECGLLGAIYDKKLGALVELKQSMLHQAFRGAL